MKKYTVLQVADLLETNPETVRRWIRSDKLPAEQSSRKGGNVITEQSLAVFLDGSPKYASKAAAKGVVVRQPVQITVSDRAPKVRLAAPVTRGAIAKVMKSRLETIDLPKGVAMPKTGLYAGAHMEEVTAKLDAQQREIRELKRLLKNMESQIGSMHIKEK